MKRKTSWWQTAIGNTASYDYYIIKMLNLAVSRFKWEGLPDSVDERFLELTLCTEGQAIYFHDEVMGDLVMQFTVAGPLNIYRLPTRRRAYAVNGYQKDLDENDSVLLFNNRLHTNDYPEIVRYAKLLYDLDQTIAVNARAQKTPIMLLCDEKQRLTLKNVYAQYDGNQPVIFGDKNLDMSGVTVLNTGAPYVCDSIYDLKSKYWNEVLTMLGISNVSGVKRERMITDEVNRSLGSTIANRLSALEERQRAADQINEMFGTNIKVSFREFDTLDENANPQSEDFLLNGEAAEEHKQQTQIILGN